MWPLARRSTERELMDDPSFGDAALRAAVLADLARLNRLTRTHEPVLRWLARAWAGRPRDAVTTVLDLGAGHGDLLRAIAARAREEGRLVHLSGIDLDPLAVAAAVAATPPSLGIEFLCADGFEHLAREAGGAAFIVSSQLAHHLSDECLVALLQRLESRAACGWCIADLHRHVLPWLGFRLLARAARWHPVIRIDGTRSIARALTPGEWRGLAARAGVAAVVARHAPFRLTVSALRGPHEPHGPRESCGIA